METKRKRKGPLVDDIAATAIRNWIGTTDEEIPRCDDCGCEMERYFEAADTGRDGWQCPSCGWSWDE